jgi:hypothetical protein
MADEYEQTIDSVEPYVDGDGVYANAEKAEAEGAMMYSHRGDSSDEVDPRNLVRDPSLSEIRWYYRRTFAKVLVDKPVDDAFKNGFDFVGENAQTARNKIEKPEFNGEGESFIGAYRLAEKKARRDGFSVIFLGTRERGTEGVHESPIDENVDVDEVSHLKVLTIDDLSEVAPHDQIKEGTGLDETQYEVRKTGIVINTDINSKDYRTPIGYVLSSPSEPQFIHKDRCIHLTWNPEVDGDYLGDGVRRWDSRRSTLGQYEGDSVLIPTYDLLKGIAKGNWAVMQALFRNASHMYSVKLPPDADDEDFGFAVDATRNINAKSSFVWPSTDYEMEQFESGNEMEPEQHYEALFDQVCAGQEMTKSVLFGTQAGTVSGSETDIKNYFNKVERYRSNRVESKVEEYLTRVKKIEDTRTDNDYTFDVDVEWGPMFKVDRETRVQMLQNETNALTTMIGAFALTPDEARSILSEDFTAVDLDDMTEDQMDVLDRINLTRSGQGAQAVRSENEYTEGPGAQSTAAASEGGQSGGMEQGQQTASGDPASDSAPADTLSEEIERLAQLHEDGILTDDEFEAAKAEVLS